MKWNEFKEWMEREGMRPPPAISRDGRVLARLAQVEATGTGNPREYGPGARRRVALFHRMSQVMGWQQLGSQTPAWAWELLDFAAPFSEGWIVVEFTPGVVFSHHYQLNIREIDVTGGVLVLPV